VTRLVTQILELHQRLRVAQTAHDREMYQRQIDATDAPTARPCTLGVDALVASRVAVGG